MVKKKEDDLREAALDHARGGRSVIPARNEPTGPKHKTPLTKHGVLDATRDPRQITNWWGEWPNALIGMACGRLSGVIVLDIDNHPNRPCGFDSVPEWLDYGAPAVKSPSGQGIHLYFKNEDGIATGSPFPGVDVRSDGCYVITPPSPGWTWIAGHPPDWDNLPPLPDRFRIMKRVITAAPDFLSKCNTGAGVSTDPVDYFSAPTEATVRAALDVLDPNCSYQDWMTIGAALKDWPFELFDQWSRGSDKYPGERMCQDKFAEFGKLGTITIATLFYQANDEDPNWRDKVEEEEADDEPPDDEPPDEKPNKPDEKPTFRFLKSSNTFVGDFVPPDYFIDGILQRQYLYSLTAPTGSGKTCVALRLAAHAATGLRLREREIDPVRVLFLAGENPDDVRMRWIKLCEEMQLDANDIDVVFLDGFMSMTTKKDYRIFKEECKAFGPFGLVIVDTAAAYNEVDDENSNAEMAKQAKRYRDLITDVYGKPTVIVTCHPLKNYNPEALSPRGGSAFVNEVDGNLVCLKEPNSTIVELHWHVKFRGPDFAPIPFRIEPGRTETIKDSKGRLIWTVTARPVEDIEQEAVEAQVQTEGTQLMGIMLTNPGLAFSAWGEMLDWSKSKVQRTIETLARDKLVEKYMRKWRLTKTGQTFVKHDAVDEDSGGM